MSLAADHERLTVRVLPEHDTVRAKLPGVVGLVVSSTMLWGLSDHGMPELPLRARPEMVLTPSPLVSVHANVGLVDE